MGTAQRLALFDDFSVKSDVWMYRANMFFVKVVSEKAVVIVNLADRQKTKKKNNIKKY